MFKAQILAKLKAKYSGLSNEFLGFVADKLAANGKITEESQIEGAIDELNNGAISLTDQASFFQSESDRRVSAAKAKWDAENKPEPDPKKVKTDGGKGPEDDETKAELQKLKEKLESFESKQKSQSITEKLHLKLKEKNIPLNFAKGRMPENEEGLDSLIAEIETDFNEVKQGFTNQGLSQMSGAPIGGNVTKDAVASDIDEWANAGKVPAK